MKKVFFGLLAAATLHPMVPSGIALLAGIAFALVIGNPFPSITKSWCPRLLQLSVVGLGAGMNLVVVGKAGLHGVGYTVVGILATFALGALIGKLLRVDDKTSTLVGAGTAICGGSAIAAVAPVIKATSAQVAVAMATVFFLNAAALFIFPWVGHLAGMGQAQFGLWSALAIHDTSSVVGASMQYGHEALEVATTVKLARALWIIPLVFALGARKAKPPFFILGFLAASAVVTWVPASQSVGNAVAMVARRFLVLTLFLIGSNLTASTLRDVGARPFLQGLLLWIVVGSATLLVILSGWVNLAYH
jgi:uncharacterized integral membrane protein (TIGR00698 family)